MESFIFHVAAILGPEVVEYFGEYFLQIIVVAGEEVPLDWHEAVVCDVDSGSVAMTRVGDRIDITLLQVLDV